MATTSKAELVRFGARRYFELEAAIAAIRIRDLGINVMVAIGSREAALMQLTNEEGTDRGVFQITDKYHRAALARMSGCPTATFADADSWEKAWLPVSGQTAADEGFVPTLIAGGQFAYRLLIGNYEKAKTEGLSGGAAVRFAIAAYNAGVGGASKGQAAGDVDKHTTGGDYSANVLERRKTIAGLVKELGWH